MIVNINNANQPQRVLTISGWVRIIIQPVAPNSIRIATSYAEALNLGGNGLADGLDVSPPNSNSDNFQVWWKGELWMIAPVNNVQCKIIIPGTQPQFSSAGSTK